MEKLLLCRTYSIASDEVTVTGYVGNESRVVIPETLEDKPVVAIGDNAFDNNSEKVKVIISSLAVVHVNIGDHAFWGATSLHTVAFKVQLLLHLVARWDLYAIYMCQQML